MAAGLNVSDRERKEMTYFSSALWRDQGLDKTRTGISALRHFLQDILDRHTERELPKVREEVRTLLKGTEKELVGLGEDRPTSGQMRMFLSRLAMRFHLLTNAALIGDYNSAELDFFSVQSEGPRRLRASIHTVNTQFSNDMRTRGETLKIQPDTDEDSGDDNLAEHIIIDQDTTIQQNVTEKQFKAYVKEVSHTSYRLLFPSY